MELRLSSVSAIATAGGNVAAMLPLRHSSCWPLAVASSPSVIDSVIIIVAGDGAAFWGKHDPLLNRAAKPGDASSRFPSAGRFTPLPLLSSALPAALSTGPSEHLVNEITCLCPFWPCPARSGAALAGNAGSAADQERPEPRRDSLFVHPCAVKPSVRRARKKRGISDFGYTFQEKRLCIDMAADRLLRNLFAQFSGSSICTARRNRPKSPKPSDRIYVN